MKETVPIRILHQDESVVVCIKPVGVDSESDMCTLLVAQTGIIVRCVHRLDRGVGGVMVYALSPASAAALSKAITDGALKKEYLAVCEGVPDPSIGEMRDLLYHDTRRNKSYVVTRTRRGVREALLDYRTLETQEGLSLVQVSLHTGRSHQIRVQFASRALPLYGDGAYGANVRTGGISLWSCRLTFPHPQSGEMCSFTAPPPDAEPWARFKGGILDDA